MQVPPEIEACAALLQAAHETAEDKETREAVEFAIQGFTRLNNTISEMLHLLNHVPHDVLDKAVEDMTHCLKGAAKPLH